MKRWTDENGINWSKPDCVDELLFHIWAIGFDYDGYESPEGLKSLINELVEMAVEARELLWEGKLFGMYGSPEDRELFVKEQANETN